MTGDDDTTNAERSGREFSEDLRPRRRAGTADGTATHVTDVIGRVEPYPGKAHVFVALENETVKIVAFEFAAGQVLSEHAAHHPIVVQVLSGRVDFTLPDRTVDLGPGEFLHLTPLLRHSVTATEDTTLTVTMLLPHD